ncbi:MAG: glycosyltransferase [Methanolobus sp.]|uniref:glycosyltransferase n=1 Tax=Methanolobus sp. TaxID=1874737 RepID=UPI00272F905A|nr:glycosyltransferase [Methanolobus sp.]MDP2217466.1 glycosyltransferase [Methanolobus sp.]
MTIISNKMKKHSHESNAGLGVDDGVFSKVIESKNLKNGVVVGGTFRGHAESILKKSTIDRLYGVDPHIYVEGYGNPINLPQEEFDQIHSLAIERLDRYNDKYLHINKISQDAVNDVPEVDFAFIDAGSSYGSIWENLCIWYSKIRVGGIIGGCGYNHPNSSSVKQAIGEFFRRFDWEIHVGGNGLWWVEKQSLNISFIMPAYNCEKTVQESVESIMVDNFIDGDELVIVNDCSTDNTENVLNNLKTKYSLIKIFKHTQNKGGAAARNTAVENAQNQLIFCLDSDNVLASGSIQELKLFLEKSGGDVASFQELRYFIDTKENITHKWIFNPGVTTLADYLSGSVVPGASGNYMFTRDSWVRAGGYPEFSRALDAWGFGLRQVATNSKMMVLPNSFYYHRYGHESYWIRESKKGQVSFIATQILIPFKDIIADEDLKYMNHNKKWFFDLEKRPIHLKSGQKGFAGKVSSKTTGITNWKMLHSLSHAFRNMVKYFGGEK